MSDKISDERLIEWRDSIQWVNSPIPVLREFAEVQVSAINELLERRAAEVKPIELPKKADASNLTFAAHGYNAAIDDCAKAIKAAGGTVEE